MNANDREIEKEWIAKAKRDHKRFAPLYDKYFKQIYLFVFKRVRDSQLAGDLTSQVFLKAMLNIKKYKDMGHPFSSWLYRIAVNEVNMYFRKNSKHQVVEVQEKHIKQLISEAGQDGEASDEEKERLMIKALDSLDEESVQLIDLRYFEQLSFKEVGAILGISEGNAKVRTYRVLDKIKGLVGNSENT